MQKIRMCLIEDDKAFIYLAKIIIQSVDNTIEVSSFLDGEQGYNFIQANAGNKDALPDAILLDLNMPCMDGWEFLDAYEKIKNNIAKDIPIYILSSSISESDIKRGKGNTLVNGYMSKPLEADKFAAILSALRAGLS